MLYKKIDELKVQDFQDLIDNGVNEGRSIEYKAELNFAKDEDRKEFLYDVSSFANAGGGDLIFGIPEKGGLPERVEGIEIPEIDELNLKLENLIRDAISPRITGLQIAAYKLPNSKHLLLIRIPKSWSSPHHVTFKGADKFYTRGSSGKYKMNVGELRNAFLHSETISERIRKFREERLSKIISNEMPIPQRDGAKIVLHLIPVSSFATNNIYDLTFLKTDQKIFTPIGLDSYYTHNYNLDGVICYPPYIEQGVIGHNSYAQMFRNGIIETVNSEILFPHNGWRKIPSSRGWNYEILILERFKEYCNILRNLQIECPVFCFLTFVGVNGYFMEYDDRNQHSRQDPPRVDRDVLILPETVIENYGSIAEQQLKPLFDMVWNACGIERSLSYDKNGNWIGV